MHTQKIAWFVLRMVMAFIFLWAFIDKLFGFGFATKTDAAWIHGGSPTSGFLSFATKGPFAEFFQSLSGSHTVEWLFMLGLLFVGVTLLINRYVMWGSIAGAVMMFLMWLAVFPPANNPLLDEHIVYICVFVLLAIRARKGEMRLRQ